MSTVTAVQREALRLGVDSTALWWLSFCDGSLPKGSQWLGACIVHAETFLDAVRVAHRLGCNPGGQVAGGEIPAVTHWLIRDGECGRLLSRDEANAFNTRKRS